MITYDSVSNYFLSTKINDNKYFSGFGTKKLGDGRNIDNIFQFFRDTAQPYKSLIILEQIHSANLFFLDEPINESLKRIDDCDALITNQSETILVVKTADCVPIIYCDKKSGLIAISHQGWRGSLKRLPQKVINKMIERGADKNSLTVCIGPSINQCCYDIDDDRYYQFLEEFNGYSDKIFVVRKGKRYLNLSYLNYLLVKDLGIEKGNIDFFPFCTSCDQERFFSFRRDRKNYQGEMFSFIIKKP